VLGYWRMLVEVGEYYTPLIVSFPQVFEPLIGLVSQCTGGQVSQSINSLAFHFWFVLAETLKEEGKSREREIFAPWYQSLMSSLIERARYPLRESYPESFQAEIRAFRESISDTLEHCCAVIGGEKCLAVALGSLSSLLGSRQGSPSWVEVEAVLFAVRSLAPQVDVGTPALSDLFATLLNIPSSFPHLCHPALQVTMNQIFRAYSTWTRRNPSSLEAQVTFLLGTLESPRHEFGQAVICSAIEAVNSLAKAAGLKLSGFLERLHPTLSSLSYPSLSSQLMADEALALLVSALPASQLDSAVSKLAAPVLADLEKIAQTPNPASSLPPLLVAHVIRRLGAIASNIKPHLYQNFLQKGRAPQNPTPPKALLLIQETWPFFERAFAEFRGSTAVLEALCSTLSNCVGTCRQHFRPMVPPLFDQLQKGFSATLHPCFLVTGAQAIQSLSSKAREAHPYDQLVSEFIDFISRTLREVLSQGSKVLEENPDIYVEFFNLLIGTIQPYSELVICWKDPNLRGFCHVLPVSVNALQTSHHDVLQKVIMFLNIAVDISQFGPILKKRPIGALGSQKPSLRIDNLWREYSEALIWTLTAGLCDHFPPNISWIEVGELFLRLKYFYGSDDLFAVMRKVFDQKVPELVQAERSEFLRSLCIQPTEFNAERTKLTFEKFSVLCRRRAGKQTPVQKE